MTFAPVHVPALLSADHIQLFRDQWGDPPLHTGTTGGDNSRRVSDVAWVPRDPAWQWVYDILWAAVRAAAPSDMLRFSDPPSGRIQFTRYIKDGFYEWHTDRTERNRRVISMTVLLSHTGTGGEFQTRPPVTTHPLYNGDAVIFPSSMSHRVTALNSGTRDSLVLWMTEPGPANLSAYPRLTLPDTPTERSHLYYLTPEQAQGGLERLVREGLVLPYGLSPGAVVGDQNDSFTTSWRRWKDWKRNGWWNPPGGLAHLSEFSEPDPNASPMPTWQELYQAAMAEELDMTRNRLKQEVYDEEERRICMQYLEGTLRPGEAPSVEKEILYRLRATGLTDKDAERDRLNGVARSLLDAIEAAADVTALDAINPTLDSEWEKQ